MAYEWWTHSVRSATLEHSGEQMAVEAMQKVRFEVAFCST